MEEKLTKIAENSLALYNRCNQYHFAATLFGDGTDSLTFKLPFLPDTVQVLCTDPRIVLRDNAADIFLADLGALGLMAGFFAYADGGGIKGTAMTVATMLSRITVEEDGTVTVHNIKNDTVPCTFQQGMPYYVVAAKLSDMELRQRYEEFVESLTGSGTAHICKAKVDAVFTAQEWAALKATKPGWTFQEV